MEEQIFFLNMFPDYEPPEELYAALSQAAIAAADIDPETRSVHVALHSERYIPQRLLEQVRKDICSLYGLQKLELTATHPESELQKIEPEELMWLFVSRNSMARGSLAGAKWEWNKQNLTVKLAANGKETLLEHIPSVEKVLRERFAAPVVIQSMLNTKTTDVEGSLKQIRQLASAGCQIARLAVPNMEAARSFADICKDSPLPLVADIHFDYRLAIAAAEGGASKIRINPGNIGGEDRVKAVVEVCKDKHIPIRIGVNGGSLDKRLLEKYGHPTAEALVESAFEHLELLEKQGFYDTCVSMKSSTVPTMVAAARLFRAKCDYPLHIGVTETGPVRQGLIKSAMGIGALLLDGIGDTIRVSLTDDPVQEVYAARDILKAAGLRKDGVNIVSCPTCGRTRIDLIGLVNRVDEALKNCEKPITVAVMGCVVNGPGEAREADIGIAGGDGWGMIFEKGVQVEKLPYDELLPALLKRIEAL